MQLLHGIPPNPTSPPPPSPYPLKNERSLSTESLLGLLWGNLEQNFKDRFCWGKDLRKYEKNSGRDGGIEEPYWGPSYQLPVKIASYFVILNGSSI